MRLPRTLSQLMNRRRSVVKALLLGALAAACMSWVVTGVARPQAEEREIASKIPAHLPIKVKVKNPEKVKDLKNEKWLGELEVEVKNTGDKPVYFLYLSLHLPGVVGPSGAEIGHQLRYGRGDLIDLAAPLQPEDVPLRPGESITVKVPASSVKGWESYKSEKGLPPPKKVEIVFQLLNHGDGTGFMGPLGSPKPNNNGQRSCFEDDAKGDAVRAVAPYSGRAPDSSRTSLLSFSPANFLPANFLPEKFISASFKPTPNQGVCCPGISCSRPPAGKRYLPVWGTVYGYGRSLF
ncbi:MAG TPA: hypothetical protein VER08_07480 [Pyrinomonadaceae bacterium]|nr:hypothetical protein [Pyrinomonadaceae bacterium]